MVDQRKIYSELEKRDAASRFFLRTPAESGKRFVDYVRWTTESEKLDYGCILDNYLTPAMPGDYITVMARPGHKKTAFMVAQAKRYARQIIQRNGYDEVVVYATWDEAVENIETYLHAGLGDFNVSDVAWGRVSPEQAIKASVQRVSNLYPLWVWGISIMDKDKRKPLFTADWLFATVQALAYEFRLTVKAIFLDYLQKIPVLDERTRVEEVSAASGSAKMLAKDVGCPVFAGVQAGRTADSREGQMPAWSDAQHTSAIEQDSTKQLALVSPIKVHAPGKIIEVDDKAFKVTDALTLVKILKQRGERGAGTFGINIDPTTLEIGDVRSLDKTVTKLE